MQKSVSLASTMDHSGRFVQLELLELAGRTLDRFIVNDSSRSSFLEVSGVAVMNSPTCSGLNAGDYKNLATVFNHPTLSQFKIIDNAALPPEIMEHFAHVQCHCLMGIFPELNRAWLTIDSDLYIWAYSKNSDVAYFDGLSETIISVGLVKPKSGVFQNFVKYLLVLTTTVEIVVLGVTLVSHPDDHLHAKEEIQLLPDPVFVLPTDGVSMVTVQSSSNGRIFLGGRDGCLYEITYQSKCGWFGKRCCKVNHSTSALSYLVPSFLNVALYDDDPIVKIEIDNTRHILYMLSEKGSIEVFDMGADGNGMNKIGRLSQRKIVQMAEDVVKTLEASNFKPVVSISAVEQKESDHLHLVAVTQTGVRLYFSTGYSESGAVYQRPFSLSLLHVRMPPGFTPDAASLKPKDVHLAAYNKGTLIMVSAGSCASEETVWCISSWGGAHEAVTAMPLPAPIHAMQQLPLRSTGAWEESRWAFASGAGLICAAALPPPAVLRALLNDGGADSQPIREFFQWWRPEQACAVACAVAAEEEGGAALRALLLHSRSTNPQQQNVTQYSQIGSPKFSPRQMSTPMYKINQDQQQQYNQHPSQQYNQNQPQQYNQNQQQQYNQTQQQQYNQNQYGQSFNQSAMRNATANSSILMGPDAFQQSISGQSPFNQSAFTNGNRTTNDQDMNAFPMQFSPKHDGIYIYVGKLLSPIWQLKCVSKSVTSDRKEYLTSCLTWTEAESISASLRRARLVAERLAASAPPSPERRSLEALAVFIRLSAETLALWRVLLDHQFHLLAAALPQDQKAALTAASFRELLVGGQEVARLLQSSLIQQYLSDHASVDSISHKLRQIAPSLYRAHDAACSKANELLMFASQQNGAAEKEDMLQQALKLCKDVAPNVNLPLLCQKFIQVDYYEGVVDLCATCASKVDPQNNALHYYKSDQPAQDHDGYFAYHRRMEIYREICAALELVYERGDTESGRRLVIACLNANDEVLHACVYEWMLARRPHSELLSIDAPASLRRHVARLAARAPPQRAVALRDVLWQLQVRAGEHAAAAETLEWLATAPDTGANLARRRAWLAAGCVAVRGAAGEAPRRLEEAAEVARVQAAVRAAAAGLPQQPPPHEMRRLDDRLLEITQLYEEYADRYNLWECKLAIIQCAGHQDAMLIESIWSNILAQEEAAVRDRPSQEAMDAILAKVTDLGKEYIHSGHCFPLPFITRQLEIISCRLSADESSVFKAMLDIGVSLDQLLDIYIRMVSECTRAWMAEGDELRGACVAAALLEEVARRPRPPRHTLARAHELHDAAQAQLAARPAQENATMLLQRLAAAHRTCLE